jgi:hypothetical protein
MTRTILYPISKVRFSICVVFLLCIAILSVKSECVPPDTQPESRPYFPPGSTVYYTFDNIGEGPQKRQINTAFNNWVISNLYENCSTVRFLEGEGDEISPKLLIKNINDPNDPYNSAKFTPVQAIGNFIYNARISFNVTAKIDDDDDDVADEDFYNVADTTSFSTVFVKITMHETGHGMGLNHKATDHPDACRKDNNPDNDQIQNSSVMNNPCGTNDRHNNASVALTVCDRGDLTPTYGTCNPPPSPSPGLVAGYGGTCQNPTENFTQGVCPSGFTSDSTNYYCCENPPQEYECDRNERLSCPPDIGYWEDYPICHCTYSPVLLDINGNGFNLSNAEGGVRFDLNGDGVTEQIAWTLTDSDDAWITLDRNGNGMIDNGLELFGSVTEQTTPSGTVHNGFLALAEFDKPERGGNSDGQLDGRDAVFNQLKIWQDTNHNAISEPDELKTLSGSDVAVIDLKYKESKRTDEFGNRFRFRAKIEDARKAKVGRWAWDVFLNSKK